MIATPMAVVSGKRRMVKRRVLKSNPEIAGIHAMQTIAINADSFMSTATPNGNYLSQYSTIEKRSRYMDIRTWTEVKDKALIRRLDAGIPLGSERF